ncbi:amidohydrolase, partial [Chloroflexota bacterium]
MNKLLYNARIYTLDSSNPFADAVLIKNGRFAAIGRVEDLWGIVPGIPSQDMEKRVLLPGLIDAHIHLQQYALSLQKVDCETSTLEECLDRVSKKAEKSRRGEWILGHGWNQNLWEEGFGNAEMLDRAAPSNPVYLTAKSLHAGWANSQSLSLAGITASSLNPNNGQIKRESDGKPSGILLESAMDIISKQIPEPNLETLVESLSHAQAELVKMGLTGVHDFDRKPCHSALQCLNERRELKLRVVKSIPLEDLSDAISSNLRTGFGDDHLWMGSLKMFADGALGPHTAALVEPYQDDPENTGILLLDRDQIFEIGSEAVQSGISLAIHAIGDRANHEVLQGFSQIRELEKTKGLLPARHRVEHVQLLQPEDLDRLAELDLVASMQ